MSKRPSMIFEDPSRRRWKKTLWVFFVLGGIGAIFFIAFVYSLIVAPVLPNIQEQRENHKKVVTVQAEIKKNDTAQRIAEKQPPARRETLFRPKMTTSSIDIADFANARTNLATAFLIQNNADSVLSFKLHSHQLDIVFPDWYSITSGTCDVDEYIEPNLEQSLRDSNVHIVARVTNASNGQWHTKEVQTILHDPVLRSCMANLLSKFTDKEHVAGLNLDIEALDPEDADAYLEFIEELATLLHEKAKILTVDVPPHDPAFDLEYLGKLTDAVVLMAYDEHYPTGTPGPIASHEWFLEAVEETLQAIPAHKLIVALGAYGYDWDTQATSPANSLTFSEIMSLAHDTEAQPELSSGTRNMHFEYQDDQHHTHAVWFLNAVTAWNEILTLRQKNVFGYGLWRLGAEDPTIWTFLNPLQATVTDLQTSSPLTTIQFASEGEIFKVAQEPDAGTLTTTRDDDGSIDYAQYTKLPKGYVLKRIGAEIPEKTLILTFDDGPDPTWTPRVLDVLKKFNVPATFFVVGDQAQKNPSLLERMSKDGFDIGNHTYFHPNPQTISDTRLRLEVNSTQRVIESTIGKQSVLFRAPYNTDANPSTLEQLAPLKTISEMGYITVGANIDSDDWMEPSVQMIVNTVMQRVQDPQNHIIVMHDAGGNRAQTIDALKVLIPKLQAAGYRFSTIQRAASLSSSVNPPLTLQERFFVQTTNIASALRRWDWFIIVWLFFFTTVISTLRILILGILVIRSARKGPQYTKGPLPSFVSIIVPAYNEEKTIAKTLHSLLKSTYQSFEILVMDDGSTDATASVVRKIAEQDHRIKLISKPNGGKSDALNEGFRRATSSIIVTIDADTLFFPTTLIELIKPLGDPTIDAVCGNVEVGNVHNALTGFQALEYITTQNFDRRAFEALNCVSVVPGAAGAWRKERILGLGGYTSDTLTEDADMTLRLLRSGGRIVYPPQARARTEAPETVTALYKQRFRWSYGTFQCLRKHRHAFFHGTLGWIALPNMFLFQIVFPVLSPIGDLVFLLSIIRGDIGAIATGYFLFLLMDVCGSLLAFTLEKRPKKLMWLILIQRFFYRQFMYVITYRSMLAVLRGSHHGWNKLKRTGRVLG